MTVHTPRRPLEDVEFALNPRAFLQLAKREATGFFQGLFGDVTSEITGARKDVALAADLQRLLPFAIMAVGALLKRPLLGAALGVGLFLRSPVNRSFLQRLIQGRGTATERGAQ